MKKTLQNMNIVIIVISIFLSTLLIGTPIEENNVQIIYIIIGIFSAMYYASKIIKKEKIITNEMDLCIVILALSTLIPLIFKTYISLTDEIYMVLKYICILSIYLIARSECRTNPKSKNIILNSIIISILVLCVIGLDEINGNYLEKFKEFINYNIIEDAETRIGSLFSYPNAMAAVAGVGIFLCIAYIFENKNMRIKVFYIAVALIMLITLILTYSRLVYIIFALVSICYGLILCKKYNVKKKINKKVLISICTLTTLLIGYVAVGLQMPKKVKIENEFQKIIYSAQGNKDYTFKFDINSISSKEDNCIIKVKEKNEYFDDLKETEIKFGSFSGSKEIKIHTQDETSVIYLNIECDKEEQSYIVINNSYLNDEKFILEYKLLPTGIVDKIQSISLNNKSAWERITFIKDAFKIIKNNWVFGLGGNAWRTIQFSVQEYNYYSQEVHCFPIQIFLEYGIIGFLACLSVGVCIFKYLFVELKKNELNMKKLSIIFAVIFISLHSLLDFNMSFFYVLLVVFLIISTFEDNETIKLPERNTVLCIILIIASVINIYISTVGVYYRNDAQIQKKGAIWNEKERFNTYYNLLPFDRNMKINKYVTLMGSGTAKATEVQNILKDILVTEKYYDDNVNLKVVYLYVKVSLNNNETLSENLQLVLDYICETEEFSKYRADFQINRLQNLKQIILILQKNNDNTKNIHQGEILKYIEKFENQFQKELIQKEKYILDYRKARYEKEDVTKYKRDIEELKNENISINVSIL